MKTLKLEHINLNKGSIYVPSTRTTNSRELDIKSWQVLSLVQYLEQDRQLFASKSNCNEDALFIYSNDRFSGLISRLFTKLKQINYNVQNINQVRASVITHWLKKKNIREVQCMAGHRYISSTEKYVQDDLENLHEIIDNLHPIN